MENNFLKEDLTREKIKKELSHTHMHEIKSYIFSMVMFFVFEHLFCAILDLMDRIDLPVRIIAWILYFSDVLFIIANIICLIRVKKGKFYVVKDIMTDKKVVSTFYIRRRLTIRRMRFDSPREFCLVFSKLGAWRLPCRNYKWSEFYGMLTDIEIYAKSEPTDWFYIAYTCKFVGRTVFNACYFEYIEVPDLDFCGQAPPPRR